MQLAEDKNPFSSLEEKPLRTNETENCVSQKLSDCENSNSGPKIIIKNNRLSIDDTVPPNINEKHAQNSRKSSTNSSLTQKSANPKLNNKKLKSPCKIFRDAIPKMSKPLAIICCVSNVLVPGLGKIRFFKIKYFDAF